MTFERRMIRAEHGAPKSTLPSSVYFLLLSNSFVVSSFTTIRKAVSFRPLVIV